MVLQKEDRAKAPYAAFLVGRSLSVPRCSLYMGMLHRFPHAHWALCIVSLSKQSRQC